MELLPCPFCGSNEIGKADAINHKGKKIYRLHCIDCDVRTKFIENENELYDAWNTRENGWISVKDRLPESGKIVICISDHKCLYISTRYKNQWQSTDGRGVLMNHHADGSPWDKVKITHWMPPQPPKETE